MDEAELNQREQALQQRERNLAARVVRLEIGEQLRAEGCRPEAIADAAALMSTLSSVEMAEDGLTVAKIALSGGEATGVAAAARAFLKARPHFQAPADDKSKTKQPIDLGATFSVPSAPAPKPAPPREVGDNASAHDMMAAGWSKSAS